MAHKVLAIVFVVALVGCSAPNRDKSSAQSESTDTTSTGDTPEAAAVPTATMSTDTWTGTDTSGTSTWTGTDLSATTTTGTSSTDTSGTAYEEGGPVKPPVQPQPQQPQPPQPEPQPKHEDKTTPPPQ